MASIQKRDNGKWRARYRDSDGNEHARHFARKIDAQQWLNTVTASVVRGDYVDPKAGLVTFTEFYDSWSTRQIWTRGTRASYDHVAGNVTFGDMPLLKIKKSHVETWVKKMSTDGLAPQTIITRIRLMRGVFKAAVGDRLIAFDPSDGIRRPSVASRASTMKIPSSEEVRALMDASEPFFRVAFVVGAFAGLRQGEICGLQLEDVDFMRQQLHVRRQVQRRMPHPVEIREPKYNSDRTIHLPQSVLHEISRHLQEFGTYGDDRWLLLGRDNGPMWPRLHEYRFSKAAEKTGLKYTSHDLRHFFASGLIAAGCDVVTVQRAMGHKSASVTLDTYSHLWPSAEEKTRVAVESIFNEAFGSPADSSRTEDQQ